MEAACVRGGQRTSSHDEDCGDHQHNIPRTVAEFDNAFTNLIDDVFACSPPFSLSFLDLPNRVTSDDLLPLYDLAQRPHVPQLQGVRLRNTVLTNVPVNVYHQLNVTALLGEGTFGEVYNTVVSSSLASNGSVHNHIREVACKKVRVTSAHRKQQLALEVEALGQLGPHVAPQLYALVRDQQSALIFMELCPCNLQQEVHRQVDGMPVAEWRRLARHMVQSLTFMWNAGFCHNDIKPENIVFSANREPKFVDFGTALKFQFAELPIFCNTGRTPHYFAPELCDLRVGDKFSPMSDVYSLGLVFLFMLIQKDPHELYAFQHGHVPPYNKEWSFNLSKQWIFLYASRVIRDELEFMFWGLADPSYRRSCFRVRWDELMPQDIHLLKAMLAPIPERTPPQELLRMYLHEQPAWRPENVPIPVHVMDLTTDQPDGSGAPAGVPVRASAGAPAGVTAGAPAGAPVRALAGAPCGVQQIPQPRAPLKVQLIPRQADFGEPAALRAPKHGTTAPPEDISERGDRPRNNPPLLPHTSRDGPTVLHMPSQKQTALAVNVAKPQPNQFSDTVAEIDASGVGPQEQFPQVDGQWDREDTGTSKPCQDALGNQHTQLKQNQHATPPRHHNDSSQTAPVQADRHRPTTDSGIFDHTTEGLRCPPEKLTMSLNAHGASSHADDTPSHIQSGPSHIQGRPSHTQAVPSHVQGVSSRPDTGPNQAQEQYRTHPREVSRKKTLSVMSQPVNTRHAKESDEPMDTTSSGYYSWKTVNTA